MKELVAALVKGIVDRPEQVEVTVREEGDAVQVMLRVAEEDKGKVIGKQGKVIKALRAVAEAAGEKEGRKVVLDLE